MGYEIVYDRKFIKVKDKYVPLFQAGSNNCWSHNYMGRQICEKNWGVWNYPHHGKYLFTEAEIRQLGEDFRDADSIYKTRNTCFKPQERVNYIINGMSSAYPVEYYAKAGYPLYVTLPKQNSIAVKTTEQLEQLLTQAELNGQRLDLDFNVRDMKLPKTAPQPKVSDKEGVYLIKYKQRYISFVNETFTSYSSTPDKLKAKQFTKEEFDKLWNGLSEYRKAEYTPIFVEKDKLIPSTEYFVLFRPVSEPNAVYFVKLTPGYQHTSRDVADARKFKTEKEAQAYLKKYPNVTAKGFVVKKVQGVHLF